MKGYYYNVRQTAHRAVRDRGIVSYVVVVMTVMLAFSAVLSGVALVGTHSGSDSAHDGIARAQSADGTVVYTGSNDQTVKAMNASTGEEIWSNDAHSDTVASVAPSPDGDVVFTGSWDNTVKALDAETGEEEWSSDAHSDLVFSVAPSPDGETVFTSGMGNTVKALDAETGEEDWSNDNYTESVVSVAPSPDGETVFTGVEDDDMKALDAETGEEDWSTDVHADAVSPAPDGEALYVGSPDGAVKELDPETGGEEWSADAHSETVQSVSISPDGETLYTGSNDETVKALDATDGAEEWSSDAHSNYVQSVAPSGDGDVVYSGSSDDTAKALNATDGDEIWSSDAHSDEVNSVAPSDLYAQEDEDTDTPDQDDSDPELSIDAPNLLNYSENASYTVLYDDPNTTGREDVTGDSAVTSSNDSVVEVDTDAEELIATNDTNVSAQVQITATYEDHTAVKDVTVASVEVKNLDILPTLWGVNAILSDSFMFALLIALFLAVAAARFTSAFGGLALGQMALTVGWFGGYVEWAMAAVSLFIALFIGLNLAANIDYQVRT